MSKFEIVLVQTKTLVVTVEADTSDKAVHIAKTDPNNIFDGRIGVTHVAGTKKVDRDTS